METIDPAGRCRAEYAYRRGCHCRENARTQTPSVASAELALTTNQLRIRVETPQTHRIFPVAPPPCFKSVGAHGEGAGIKVLLREERINYRDGLC